MIQNPNVTAGDLAYDFVSLVHVRICIRILVRLRIIGTKDRLPDAGRADDSGNRTSEKRATRMRPLEPLTLKRQSGFGPSTEFSSTLPVFASTPISCVTLPALISNE